MEPREGRLERPWQGLVPKAVIQVSGSLLPSAFWTSNSSTGRDLLEMQTLRPHPRPGSGAQNSVLTSPPRGSVAHSSSRGSR